MILEQNKFALNHVNNEKTQMVPNREPCTNVPSIKLAFYKMKPSSSEINVDGQHIKLLSLYNLTIQ
jgi:hypothetical protein